METAKKPGRYGRSCRVCKVYFLTNDPNEYTCPWCQKGEKGTTLVEADYETGSVAMDEQMLVPEEVR